MAYVIAEPCIGTKDTACVDSCPVDCIHPKKDSDKFGTEEMLYIDPWNASTAALACRCARYRPSSRSMICRKSGKSTPNATRSISGDRALRASSYELEANAFENLSLVWKALSFCSLEAGPLRQLCIPLAVHYNHPLPVNLPWR